MKNRYQLASRLPFRYLLLLAMCCFLRVDARHYSKTIKEELQLQDSTLNILVLGTNRSIDDREAFSPDDIATELQNILANDPSIMVEVNVVAENIHMSKSVTLGLGGAGTEYTWNHYSHSLLQYYYWPDGRDARMDNLSGKGNTDWDYVVIGADPSIISMTPGFYSLGVNKLAAKVAEGNAEPLLLMTWPKDNTDDAAIKHFEEFTYRTADGSKVPLQVVPAGLAWQSLPADKKDITSKHPSPNGAYAAAATIYAHIYNKNASTSDYTYDDDIATVALSTKSIAEGALHYSGIPTFISPFNSCNISDVTINYNHTGTSSENGIKAGLNWIFNQSPKTLQNGGSSPINLNYGRANTNFEPNKRYKIDPELFDFSFGFPMQDHGNHGNTSLLFGIDKRDSGTLNDTDYGVAQYMVQQSEIPYGRAIPVRTLFAQMKEAIPEQSAYRDSWHMHRDLDKAIAAYMYTILNGTCVLGEEPTDKESDLWKTWMSHKIGYETAWNLMYMEGTAPICSELFDLDGDGFNSYVDCNDNDINVNPDQLEIPYNGIDDDCNNQSFDDDLDQDGFNINEDCDDNNSNINPDQLEIPYNGIDDDCNSQSFDDDLDQDGFNINEDCDDNNPSVNPDQLEIPYNGIDDDCNSQSFDDDLDQDGFNISEDCDDNNSNVNPDQLEIPYNGIDDDCNNQSFDDDLDQDGFNINEDCDDNNSNINPDADEIPNNGIDEDCDGMDLTTSSVEISNVFINVFPNPVENAIFINVEGDLIYSTTLYNIEGNQIHSSSNANSIDVSSFPSGMYVLKILDLSTGKYIIKKLIKR